MVAATRQRKQVALSAHEALGEARGAADAARWAAAVAPAEPARADLLSDPRRSAKVPTYQALASQCWCGLVLAMGLRLVLAAKNKAPQTCGLTVADGYVRRSCAWRRSARSASLFHLDGVGQGGKQRQSVGAAAGGFKRTAAKRQVWLTTFALPMAGQRCTHAAPAAADLIARLQRQNSPAMPGCFLSDRCLAAEPDSGLAAAHRRQAEHGNAHERQRSRLGHRGAGCAG